ncbi:glycoside hydrolase family 16 protein [Rubellimicrobium roseum]|uniref:Glycoside hydrolase family 16 protein n=1 Tax=Rubellimicrobium roseum TaxID=687525 RepID=A0A5C4NDT5_9RHOB|nr:glycoside hydrolase family 16 protein [Rubellimicrobium roseum]
MTSRPFSSFPSVQCRRYRLEFEDDFEGHALDQNRWFPHFLPHWSSRAQSQARYVVADGCLTLRVDRDQGSWCPELDPATRVSHVQTGHRSGPLGSTEGQHRFKPGLRVREALAPMRLYLPHYGAIEMRARADLGPDGMAALWLIGWEDRPEDSGEITVMEVFGRSITEEGAQLGHGIKAITDPRLVTDFADPLVPFDVADWHVYAAEWTPDSVSFLLDGEVLRHVAQSPDYPMQLMLDVFAFADVGTAGRDRPNSFSIDWVRGHVVAEVQQT